MLEITFYKKKKMLASKVTQKLSSKSVNSYVTFLFVICIIELSHFIPPLHCFVRLLHISIIMGLWKERKGPLHITYQKTKWNPTATSRMPSLNPLPAVGVFLVWFWVLVGWLVGFFFNQGTGYLRKKKNKKDQQQKNTLSKGWI